MRPWLTILAIALLVVMAVAFLSTVMSSSTPTGDASGTTAADGAVATVPAGSVGPSAGDVTAAAGPSAGTATGAADTIKSTEPILIETTYAFEGRDATYAWTDVSIAFDTKTYLLEAQAAADACSVAWSVTDSAGQVGFTVEAAPHFQAKTDRTYRGDLEHGPLTVTSTCPTWRLTVSEATSGS